ncbi:MAG: discoidin domain-containing protein, partial [Oscillospiraceae bacterium]
NDEVSASTYFVSKDEKNTYGVSAEKSTLQMDLEINQNLPEQKTEIFSSNGELLTEIIMTQDKIKFGHDSNGVKAFTESAYAPNTVAKIKYSINTITHNMEIFLNGKSIFKGEFYKKATDISYLKYSTGISHYGIFYADNVYLSIISLDRNQTTAKLDAYNLSFEKIKGSEANLSADKVAVNLNLPNTGVLGSQITWTSSAVDVIENNGVINRAEVDKAATLTANVSFGGITETVIIPLVIKGLKPGNIAFKKTATANFGGETAMNAIDTVSETSWICKGTHPMITVDLGKAESVSRVVLMEYSENGEKNVKKFEIQTSQDGKKWATVHVGETVGERLTVDFPLEKARYVRYEVLESDTKTTGLKEMEVRFEPSDIARVTADKEALIWDEYIIKGSTILKTKGEFGSDIIWESSRPEVLSNDGKTFKKPDNDTKFTMTATISYGKEKIKKDF